MSFLSKLFSGKKANEAAAVKTTATPVASPPLAKVPAPEPVPVKKQRAPEVQRHLNASMLRAITERDGLVARMFIEDGADINSTTEDGWSALLATLADDTDLALHLLKLGADPNIASEMGLTPLMRAAAKGKIEVVEELIRHGANLFSKDFQGMDAVDMALQKEEEECANIILDAIEKELAASHPHLLKLEGAYLVMMRISAPATRAEYHLTQAQFDESEVVENVKVYAKTFLDVPDDCVGKVLSRLRVYSQQP